MRIGLIASLLLLTATVPVTAQVSLSINIGSYPNFSAVPGYPVYYAPDVSANYFFYDGQYWLYQDDNWYSSTWYNGPWDSIDPMYVPIYVLQVPVRYYRRPPQYFRGWQPNQSPRWDDHWGHDWAQRRPGWNRPRYEVNVAPAPLPDYQRRYSGKDYPRAEQQQAIRQQNYHYVARRSDASRDSDRRSNEHKPGFVKPDMPVQPARRAPQQEQRLPVAPKPAQPQARESQDRPDQGRGNAGAREGDKKQKPHQDQAGERDQNRDQNH